MKQRFTNLLPDVNICLLGLQGSRMLGMNITGDADYDYRGIYIAKNEEILSLNQKPREQYIYNDSRDDEMDYVIYEIEKFIRLALKGNPFVLHIFFVPKHEIKTAMGDYLVKHRDIFLGEKPIRAAFGGYAMSQIMYLNKSGKFKKCRQREKHIRHCFRLFDSGAELLKTGNMTFPLPKEKVEEYFELSKSDDNNKLFRIFKERDQAFQQIKSCLPKKPNDYMANKILLKIRNYEKEKTK